MFYQNYTNIFVILNYENCWQRGLSMYLHRTILKQFEWTVSTAPGVSALGWVKCREHISLLVILCIIVHVTKKIIYIYNFFFLQNRYPIMVKCSNIVKNTGKPISRPISRHNLARAFPESRWCLHEFCSQIGVFFVQTLHERLSVPQPRALSLPVCYCMQKSIHLDSKFPLCSSSFHRNYEETLFFHTEKHKPFSVRETGVYRNLFCH